MLAALAILDRSQDPGKHEAKVQPNTFRKVQAAISNISRAGVGGLGDQVGAHERNKVWISSSATHQHWFSRFMTGIRRRTGQVIKQDKAVTIEVMHAVNDLLEDRWNQETSVQAQLKVARMGLWYNGGFCSALRGEEMLIVEFAGTANSLVHLEPGRHQDPYFYFTVTGPTKSNREAGATFKIPCAGTTKSGLKPGVWATRYINLLRTMGVEGGYLFSKHEGRKSRLSDFEDEFLEVLEEIQDTCPSLISPELDVRDEYGIWRSLRRGATSHATNCKIPETLIYLINRWRLEKDRQGQSGDMVTIYTDLEDLIPTLIRYSLAF